MDESELRRKAREVIQAGGMPERRPGRTWGGPGGGGECAICGDALAFDEMELELEFAPVSDGEDQLKRCVHVHCFAAWELELQSADARLGKNGFAAPQAGPLVDGLSGAREDGTITRRERDQTYRP